MTSGFPDWTKAIVLLGTDGTQYIPVLLDAEGNLNVLMRGEYEGELRTIKLDDEGRISAFVIDSTDAWGNMLSVGNAELAARLGSPVCFDRRGLVQYLDNFQNGMPGWATSVFGTGAAVAIDPTTAFRSGYSVKVTGGSDGAAQASIYRLFPFLAVGKMGMEVGFTVAVNIDGVAFGATVYDGTTARVLMFRWGKTTGRFMIQTPGPAWTVFAEPGVLHTSANLYNVVKVVGDVVTSKYVRVLANGVEYDLSAYSLYSFADVTPPHVNANVVAFSRAGNNDSINVGQVVVTNQES